MRKMQNFRLARISLAMTYFLLLVELVCAVFESFVFCAIASVFIGVFYGLAFFYNEKSR